MSSANVEGMLREGVNALKAGRRDEARALLLRAVELDQYNEEAWLWLSGVLDSLDDQRTALENVLSISPGNERARQGLDYINKQLGIPSDQSRSSAAIPAAPSSMPTSVEWGAPPDSPPGIPSGTYRPPTPEPSAEILDDWVSNLGLQSNPMTGAGAQLGTSASPFGDADLDDDIFSAGPFRADEPPSSAAKPTILPAERTARRRARGEARRNVPEPTARKDAISAPVIETLFPGIPADIMPTRLPGTVERAPVVTTILIVLLVVANIAIAVYFMVGFFCSDPIHCPWV
jgi:hypothetical protein